MDLFAPGGEDRMFKCPEKVLPPTCLLAIVNKTEIGIIISADIPTPPYQEDFQTWEKSS